MQASRSTVSTKRCSMTATAGRNTEPRRGTRFDASFEEHPHAEQHLHVDRWLGLYGATRLLPGQIDAAIATECRYFAAREGAPHRERPNGPSCKSGDQRFPGRRARAAGMQFASHWTCECTVLPLAVLRVVARRKQSLIRRPRLAAVASSSRQGDDHRRGQHSSDSEGHQLVMP